MDFREVLSSDMIAKSQTSNFGEGIEGTTMSKDRMPGRDPGEVLADARQRAGALLAELRALFPIGAAGAEAYLRVRGAILEDVNRSLLSRDDIEKLLGGRPRQVMT